MIFVKIQQVPGDKAISTSGYDDGNWFIAESFGFGVEREMKESGEKGGTEDINIGVGELQECNISKSMDMASTKLCQYAINGNSPGAAEIHFVEIAGGDGDKAAAKPLCYLAYVLDRCFVKSWSTSGDADDRPTEEVAFYYNRIAFNYSMSPNGRTWEQQSEMKWDNTVQSEWIGGSTKSGRKIPNPPSFTFDATKGGFQVKVS
jgi:type VI secretion system secreted protein Hcp